VRLLGQRLRLVLRQADELKLQIETCARVASAPLLRLTRINALGAGMLAAILGPVPQKAGPPLMTINPKAALPFGGPTYDGTGYVSSGFLTPHENYPARYTLTFTKPGTYSYDCLVHPGMDGTITVLP
jgi:hypothetical protein